jgi:hypothetical protein
MKKIIISIVLFIGYFTVLNGQDTSTSNSQSYKELLLQTKKQQDKLDLQAKLQQDYKEFLDLSHSNINNLENILNETQCAELSIIQQLKEVLTTRDLSLKDQIICDINRTKRDLELTEISVDAIFSTLNYQLQLQQREGGHYIDTTDLFRRIKELREETNLLKTSIESCSKIQEQMPELLNKSSEQKIESAEKTIQELETNLTKDYEPRTLSKMLSNELVTAYLRS